MLVLYAILDGICSLKYTRALGSTDMFESVDKPIKFPEIS